MNAETKQSDERIRMLESALRGLEWCAFCSGGVGDDGRHDEDCPLFIANDKVKS